MQLLPHETDRRSDLGVFQGEVVEGAPDRDDVRVVQERPLGGRASAPGRWVLAKQEFPERVDPLGLDQLERVHPLHGSRLSRHGLPQGRGLGAGAPATHVDLPIEPFSDLEDGTLTRVAGRQEPEPSEHVDLPGDRGAEQDREVLDLDRERGA